jgi:natural product biosynthesis luciferase-like monooxygenase protein
MVIGLLAILKAGGAYVPLDPGYPAERLAYIVRDTAMKTLLVDQENKQRWEQVAQELKVVCWQEVSTSLAGQASTNPVSGVSPQHLAYVIYTSGSTGKPKGVAIQHQSVINFFTGVDQRAACGETDELLAVTSVSFDISVLELLWPLTHGAKIIVATDNLASQPSSTHKSRSQRALDFSLFYFASGGIVDAQEQYRLLVETTKFADHHDFTSVWVPERHFHEFGGLYPNPSVLAAALAMMTERIHIRAGSVVLPLHHPLRVVEEWAVVDNLSRGRVGISFASGWHADDFVLAPEKYQNRKEEMFQAIELVKQLWKGETAPFQGGTGKEVAVKVYPSPVQPSLPVWVTSAGNRETFIKAGEIGANILTHLLGQTVEEVGENIALYRDSLTRHGFDADSGRVTLMLHTFVGENLEEVREHVRVPFCNYLRSSLSLLSNMARNLGFADDICAMTSQDVDSLISFAFDRYFNTAALFGTPETCLPLIGQLKEIQVDEIACLVDFGVEVDTVLASLKHLDRLRQLANTPAEDISIEHLFATHAISMLQCTPSMMKMLLFNPAIREQLQSVQTLMLGGEALPVTLAKEILSTFPGRLLNMYGPTETTIWSAIQPLEEVQEIVPIGQPIANTQLYIVDAHLRLTPIGVPGELLIGGEGLARGYLHQMGLTAERFLPDPFSLRPGALLYRTGDRARYRPDGTIEFLGRADQQVKIRGYRIEPGEIEAVLRQHPAIRETAVIAYRNVVGDQQLVCYIEASHTLLAQELRIYLQQYVPEYMIPSVFIALDALPLTPNGKINRRALPSPEEVVQEQAFVAPATPLEKVLADIWKDLLGKESIGIYDNFFELGGHSLAIAQLALKIRTEFHVEIPLRDIFEAPTIVQLAEKIVLDQAEQESNDELSQMLAELEQLSDQTAQAYLSEEAQESGSRSV